MTDLNFPFSDLLLDFPLSDDDLLQTPTTTFPEVDAAVLDWLSITTTTTPTSILDPAWTSYPVKTRTKGKTRKRRELHPVRVLRRSCSHCETEETPQWRTGPAGPKTLCNACGVRFKSGRLFPEYRPAKSPGFREEVHSNSHKVVMERRRRGGVETVLSRVPARRAGGV